MLKVTVPHDEISTRLHIEEKLDQVKLGDIIHPNTKNIVLDTDKKAKWWRRNLGWRLLHRYKNWRAIVKRARYLKQMNVAQGVDMKMPRLRVDKPFRRW